jgi:uridylate kinase
MYTRILLKLSGEVFAENKGQGLVDFSAAVKVAKEIAELKKHEVQIGIVLGAGNIYRGRFVKSGKIDIDYAHYMGMLGTVINALALQAVFRSRRIKSVVQSEFAVAQVVEPISPSKARQYLSRGYIVIFAGGTGRPRVTTDTAAALRAWQIKADIIFKATDVAGVYDKDPDKYQDAKLYKRLSFAEAVRKKLAVMDQEAFALAKKHKIPILVFKWRRGCLIRAIKSKNFGTLVS